MRFLSALRNEARDKRAWFAITTFLSAINIFLIFELVSVSGRVNNVLIPSGLIRGRVPVQMTAAKNAHNAQYLTTLAISDMSLLADWTPNTVKYQMARFIARLAPTYLGSQETVLLHAATRDSGKSFSQTFFVDGTVARGNTVSLTGELERWKHGAPQSSADMKWVLRYQWVDDIPYIDKVSESEVKSHG